MSRRVLIVEDEHIAGERLSGQIRNLRPDYQILALLQSVQEAEEWLLKNEAPDLIFLDIHLSDGLSFALFSRIEVTIPIIFTTAYDQYAIKAFKVNSIDYLLKPIDDGELASAIEKFERRQHSDSARISTGMLDKLAEMMVGPKYKHRFLVKYGPHFQYLNVDDICYFYSEDGVLFALNLEANRYIIDGTLESVEGSVDPNIFFRINRKALVHINSILRVHPYLNSRLKLECQPGSNLELVVARERVGSFKKWLDDSRD